MHALSVDADYRQVARDARPFATVEETAINLRAAAASHCRLAYRRTVPLRRTWVLRRTRSGAHARSESRADPTTPRRDRPRSGPVDSLARAVGCNPGHCPGRFA